MQRMPWSFQRKADAKKNKRKRGGATARWRAWRFESGSRLHAEAGATGNEALAFVWVGRFFSCWHFAFSAPPVGVDVGDFESVYTPACTCEPSHESFLRGVGRALLQHYIIVYVRPVDSFLLFPFLWLWLVFIVIKWFCKSVKHKRHKAWTSFIKRTMIRNMKIN